MGREEGAEKAGAIPGEGEEDGGDTIMIAAISACGKGEKWEQVMEAKGIVLENIAYIRKDRRGECGQARRLVRVIETRGEAAAEGAACVTQLGHVTTRP